MSNELWFYIKTLYETFILKGMAFFTFAMGILHLRLLTFSVIDENLHSLIFNYIIDGHVLVGTAGEGALDNAASEIMTFLVIT